MTETFDTAPAIDLLVEMMRNACVNTGDPASGGEIRSVRTIQEFLGATGTVIEPLPGRASVVYRHEGSDPSSPKLLLIPHLDVVPADASDWTYDPFSGTRADGYVWGRGAVDMLNVTAAMVTIFRAIRDGEIPPPMGDVILAAVADEEAGATYGAAELVDNHWELIECDAVLTEVAGPPIGKEGQKVIPVTVAEKGPAWRVFTSTGLPGHGSQPYRRDNAVLSLSEAFSRIGSAAQPSLVTDEWKAFVKYLPIDEDLQIRLCDEQTLDDAIDAVAEQDETLGRWIHACTHLTFSPNTMAGGTKANMVPDHAVGDVDVRMLPGQDRTDIDDHLRKVLGPDLYDQLEIEPVREMTANGSPPSGPLWEAMEDASELHTGTRDLAPALTPMTTDARFFRARGIPSYGVGLFDETVTFAEMLAMFHGIDERVSEQSVLDTTAFLSTVVQRFGFRARSDG
jgi:acetylornithine deacetylase/succinyl-diaminopimelate desuccinylase-like protein